MAVVTQAALAALTAVAFGLVYQVSGTNLLWAGGIGGLAWLVASGVGLLPHDGLLPDLVGAFVVGALAEWAAYWRREPVSVFVVPAIIAFVPGYSVYQSMVAFLKGQFLAGMKAGMTAVMAAGALSIGLALATAIIRPWVRGRKSPRA